MKLGIHVSTAGGIDKAVDRAAALGCNTFQIFVSNPRGWKPTEIPEETCQLFKEKYEAAEMKNAFAHSIYLVNLASPKVELRQASIESLVTGLANTHRLGLDCLVTHIGSHGGDGLDVGTDRVIDSLNQILSADRETAILLLENTAGAGNLVGKNFKEIGDIIREVQSERLGICLDTAHAFESGYDFRSEDGLENMIAEIDSNIGLEKLKAIHLNDSMTDLGSNRDRHENYGQGLIGEAALTRLINHPKLRDKPFVMETPEFKQSGGTEALISRIRSLQKTN